MEGAVLEAVVVVLSQRMGPPGAPLYHLARNVPLLLDLLVVPLLVLLVGQRDISWAGQEVVLPWG